MEASGRLVAPAVFKTDVVEHLDQAGSIPVRLRDRFAFWPARLWRAPLRMREK
jgi:hypothetical protein